VNADMRRATRFVRRGLGTARRFLAGAVGSAYLRWRRSIQVRVVTSTRVVRPSAREVL